MRGPMEMIFGLFSETYVRLLTSIAARDIAQVITI